MERISINPSQTTSFNRLEKEGYHEIQADKRPKVQYFTSLLVRGNINASQIIKEGDKYFSHQQKIEDIAPTEDFASEQFADRIVLEYVFHDQDHFVSYNPKESVHGDIEHKNLIVNNEADRYSHFDFGAAFLWETESIVSDQDAEEFQQRVREAILNGGEWNEVTQHRAEKVRDLADKFLSINFKDDAFLKAVIAKSETDLTSPDFRQYFDGFHQEFSDTDSCFEAMFNDIKLRLELSKEAAERMLI